MNDSSININTRYTQESDFEQGINSNIASFWHSREEGYLKSFDKTSLYWVKHSSPDHSKAILIINGRIECCAKYQELFYDLFQLGYDIYSYDHRGQGWSESLVNNHIIGHINEFDDYVKDLDCLLKEFDLSKYNKCYALGHSMGGNIITRYVQTHPHPFQSIALTAPMFGINLPWYLKPIASSLGQLLTALHPKPTLAPGQTHYVSKAFEQNRLSHSKIRYHWFRNLYEKHPEFQVGGVSTRWIWQALVACKQCYLMTRQVQVPLLVLQASKDEIVDNQSQVKFLKKLAKTSRVCAFKIIYGAKHELLFEQDQFRNQTLDSLLTFFEQS